MASIMSKTYHINLFEWKDGVTGVFKIYPPEACREREGNLKKLIELAGGVVLEENEEDPYMIPIVDVEWFVNADANAAFADKLAVDHFDPSFVYDCYEWERVFDLNAYRWGKSQFLQYDANQILKRRISWSDLFLQTPPGSPCRDTRISKGIILRGIHYAIAPGDGIDNFVTENSLESKSNGDDIIEGENYFSPGVVVGSSVTETDKGRMDRVEIGPDEEFVIRDANHEDEGKTRDAIESRKLFVPTPSDEVKLSSNAMLKETEKDLIPHQAANIRRKGKLAVTKATTKPQPVSLEEKIACKTIAVENSDLEKPQGEINGRLRILSRRRNSALGARNTFDAKNPQSELKELSSVSALLSDGKLKSIIQTKNLLNSHLGSKPNHVNHSKGSPTSTKANRSTSFVSSFKDEETKKHREASSRQNSLEKNDETDKKRKNTIENPTRISTNISNITKSASASNDKDLNTEVKGPKKPKLVKYSLIDITGSAVTTGLRGDDKPQIKKLNKLAENSTFTKSRANQKVKKRGLKLIEVEPVFVLEQIRQSPDVGSGENNSGVDDEVHSVKNKYTTRRKTVLLNYDSSETDETQEQEAKDSMKLISKVTPELSENSDLKSDDPDDSEKKQRGKKLKKKGPKVGQEINSDRMEKPLTKTERQKRLISKRKETCTTDTEFINLYSKQTSTDEEILDCSTDTGDEKKRKSKLKSHGTSKLSNSSLVQNAAHSNSKSIKISDENIQYSNVELDSSSSGVEPVLSTDVDSDRVSHKQKPRRSKRKTSISSPQQEVAIPHSNANALTSFPQLITPKDSTTDSEIQPELSEETASDSLSSKLTGPPKNKRKKKASKKKCPVQKAACEENTSFIRQPDLNPANSKSTPGPTSSEDSTDLESQANILEAATSVSFLSEDTSSPNTESKVGVRKSKRKTKQPTKFETPAVSQKLTGAKRFACEHCEFVAPKAFELLNHQRVHTGESQFRCSNCDFSSPVKSALFKHKKQKHSSTPASTVGPKKGLSDFSEKPYKCNHDGCGYKTSTAYKLRVHLNTH